MTQISFDTAFYQWDRSSHISRCFFPETISDKPVESFRLFDDDCSWWWSRCSLLKADVQSTKYFLNSEKKKKCFNVLTFLELQNFVYISSPFILARGRDVWPSCVLSICILWPWFRGVNDAVLVLTRNTFVYLCIWKVTVTWKEYLSSWTYLTKVFHEISFSIVFLAFGSRYSWMDQVKFVEDSL